MPQLMPLPWIFSCFMIVFLLLMMKFVYGGQLLKLMMNKKVHKSYFLKWLW